MKSPVYKADKDVLFRCECGESHFLRVSWNDPEYPYLVLEGQFGPAPFKHRLKGAFNVLFRRKHYDTWCEVHLDAETVPELTKVLEQVPTE